jgi:hypothetical protein
MTTTTMPHWFSLAFSDAVIRRMTRDQYYAAHRYRRVVQRTMRDDISPPDFTELYSGGLILWGVPSIERWGVLK